MFKDRKNKSEGVNQKKRDEKHEVKIKYDIHTPDDRDPQPKAFDEIEY